MWRGRVKRKGDFTSTRITVSQKDVLDEGGLWPIATKVLVNYGKTETQTRIEWKTAKTEFITGKGGRLPALRVCQLSR